MYDFCTWACVRACESVRARYTLREKAILVKAFCWIYDTMEFVITNGNFENTSLILRWKYIIFWTKIKYAQFCWIVVVVVVAAR